MLFAVNVSIGEALSVVTSLLVLLQLQYGKILIISPGLTQLHEGSNRAYKQYWWTYNWTKKVFQKTSYKAVFIKILFEFDHFFKLQNVLKSWIHLNSCYRGVFIWVSGGAYNWIYFFCLQLDGPIKGGL